jgi:hypothetical protein
MQLREIQVVPHKPLYLRIYQDGSLIVGVDQDGSWCSILSLCEADRDEKSNTQLLIRDFVYHEALPDLGIDYRDLMRAIRAAHWNTNEPEISFKECIAVPALEDIKMARKEFNFLEKDSYCRLVNSPGNVYRIKRNSDDKELGFVSVGNYGEIVVNKENFTGTESEAGMIQKAVKILLGFGD